MISNELFTPDPSVEEAVIVTVPVVIVVTVPSASTVAIPLLELLQTTSVFVALAGIGCALNDNVRPFFTTEDSAVMSMELTIVGVTIRLNVSYRPEPSAAYAVIVTSPTDLAVTSPFSSTVAMEVLDDL